MTESKLQNLIISAVIGVVALAGYWVKKSNSTETLKPEDSFSYEMPRPRSYSADFDISNREIVRNVETAGDEVPNEKWSITPPLPLPSPRSDETDGKNPQTRGQEKKAANTQDAKNKKQNNSAVRIADTRPDNTLGRSADSSGGSTANGVVSPAYYTNTNPQNQATSGDGNNTATDDTPKMSAAQWRSLLMSQPTAANGAQFLTAYKKSSVDASTFYQITTELLTDTAKDRQTLGLNLLQQTPSLRSLTALINSSSQIQDSALRTQAMTAIAAYAQPANFYVLSQALYSKDLQIIATATQLIGTALANLESVQGQGGQQGSGSSSSQAGTPQQFQIFIPGLRDLTSSGDASVAAQAQNLLKGIEAVSSHV
jgi:hypothetical protein